MARTWLTARLVLDYLQDQAGEAVPEGTRPALDQAVAAVAEWVEDELHPGYWNTATPPEYEPPADIKLGAVMYAARLYERRGSMLGVAGYSELGGSPILREDPDIARLLRIGRHRAFTFGAPTIPAEEVV